MKYFVIIFLFFLQGCNTSKPEREDFIGTWKAQDGAILALYENGNCKIIKFKNQVISRLGKDTTYIVNTDGIWEFVVNEKGIDISYPEGRSYEYRGKVVQSKIVIHLDISGQGFSGNKPPWNLYSIIGDPDNRNKYLFTKQK